MCVCVSRARYMRVDQVVAQNNNCKSVSHTLYYTYYVTYISALIQFNQVSNFRNTSHCEQFIHNYQILLNTVGCELFISLTLNDDL